MYIKKMNRLYYTLYYSTFLAYVKNNKAIRTFNLFVEYGILE